MKTKVSSFTADLAFSNTHVTLATPSRRCESPARLPEDPGRSGNRQGGFCYLQARIAEETGHFWPNQACLHQKQARRCQVQPRFCEPANRLSRLLSRRRDLAGRVMRPTLRVMAFVVSIATSLLAKYGSAGRDDCSAQKHEPNEPWHGNSSSFRLFLAGVQRVILIEQGRDRK